MDWPVALNLSEHNFLISSGLALSSGVILSCLYGLYGKGQHAKCDPDLKRSFVLLVPSLSMVFALLSGSAALSLGLIGAISLVRYRAKVKSLVDIAFLMVGVGAALGSSLQYVLPVLLLMGTTALFAVSAFARTPAPKDFKTVSLVRNGNHE